MKRQRGRIAKLRDDAIEEAKDAIDLTTIEFHPNYYTLTLGQELLLIPEFKSGSGKNMIAYGVEWTANTITVPSDIKVIDIDPDTGLVTALAPGEAIVDAVIGDVRGNVLIKVTDESICAKGAVTDAKSKNLIEDCEVLL